MPEIKFDSEFLKANVNVEDGDHIKFLDTGKKDADGRWIFLVHVIEKGTQKKFSLNKANFKRISAAYGTNSDEWKGKEMIVNIVSVQNPQGEEVEGIRLKAPFDGEGDEVL